MTQGVPAIDAERLARLRETMSLLEVSTVLTADPINIFYATGVRNMTIFSMMGASRFALVTMDGPIVVWEYSGTEHLIKDSGSVTEVRTAPGVTALAGPTYPESIRSFVGEVVEVLESAGHREQRIAVERFDHPVTDALRASGFELQSATEVFAAARLIKTPHEILAMRDGVRTVTRAVESMRREIRPGRTEVEVWAELHRNLIADNGEYISTRLAQTGHRTFPYFHEAGTTEIADGDFFCVDTDAIGPHGYGVDFSRTFVCGDATPTAIQQSLHATAVEQLAHNAARLEPGRTFESFAREAWQVPDRFAPFGYYCLGHGLGLSGEYPYLPPHDPSQPYPLHGSFEPGMVICIESYIGDPDSHQGAKVEDQYLITDDGVEQMSTMPHRLT